jgi:hypothetical protein
MTKNYRWACQLCGASNAPAAACTQCKFPAEASAAEIDLARSQGVEAVFQRREEMLKGKAEWLAQPFWVKSIDVFALTLLILGAVLGKFAGPIEYNALGLVMSAVSLTMLWLVHRE